MKIFMLIILLLVAGSCLNLTAAEDTVSNTVSSVLEKAKEDSKNMTVPENKYAKEGLNAANKTVKTYDSPSFQDQIQYKQQLLTQKLFDDFTTSWKKKDVIEEQSGQTVSLADSERVYLFFSSSIPDKTVRKYLSAIADAGAPYVIPVMHGFVRGLAERKTNTEYFSRILKKDPDCQDIPSAPCQRHQLGIKLNPALFAQYGITRVPAVVYENKGNGFLIQGDAGLDYLLERINREANSPSLATLISKMRGRLE